VVGVADSGRAPRKIARPPAPLLFSRPRGERCFDQGSAHTPSARSLAGPDPPRLAAQGAPPKGRVTIDEAGRCSSRSPLGLPGCAIGATGPSTGSDYGRVCSSHSGGRGIAGGDDGGGPSNSTTTPESSSGQGLFDSRADPPPLRSPRLTQVLPPDGGEQKNTRPTLGQLTEPSDAKRKRSPWWGSRRAAGPSWGEAGKGQQCLSALVGRIPPIPFAFGSGASPTRGEGLSDRHMRHSRLPSGEGNTQGLHRRLISHGPGRGHAASWGDHSTGVPGSLRRAAATRRRWTVTLSASSSKSGSISNR